MPQVTPSGCPGKGGGRGAGRGSGRSMGGMEERKAGIGKVRETKEEGQGREGKVRMEGLFIG